MSDDMRIVPETKPNPDPTIATNEAVERAMKSERDYVDGEIGKIEERLKGMDAATDLRLQAIDHIPGRIDEKVSHLAALTDERFDSFGKQLDIAEAARLEQKADAKTGLDAALAAQKEAAAETNRSNTLAISKSELATAEKLDKLEELFTTRTQALVDKIDAVTGRFDRSESNKHGGDQQRVETRQSLTAWQGIAATLVALAVLLVGIYAAVHTARAPSTQFVPVTVTTGK